MAAPYSLDLRERVVRAAQEGPLSRAEVAEQFSLGERTVYRWLAQSKEDPTLAPKPHAGGRVCSVDEEGQTLLRDLVEEQNDRTLAEYAQVYEQKRGVHLSRSALHRVLARLDLPRKKKRFAPQSATARM